MCVCVCIFTLCIKARHGSAKNAKISDFRVPHENFTFDIFVHLNIRRLRFHMFVVEMILNIEIKPSNIMCLCHFMINVRKIE